MIDVTPFLDTLDKKTVAVLGLGASGVSVVRALRKAGAKGIYGWDDKQDGRKQGEKAGATVTELSKDILAACDVLVAAPGVPLNHPVPHSAVERARALNIPIVGDIEIFYRSNPDRPIIALTGTNGKSTSTTLITHILNACGKKAVLAGNIGLPVLDMKLPPKKDGVIVLELSSFQLDLCSTFSADIGVILNLTPDHIDRHGTVNEYAMIKESIFKGDGQAAVIGVDDEYCEAIYGRLKDSSNRQVIPISIQKQVDGGVSAVGGMLKDGMSCDAGEDWAEIGSLNNITKLHGAHNKQNAAAAYAVCRAMGLDSDAILEAIKTYPGLPHRQFPVRVINGVSYINDSKATNAEAAGKALACNHNIYWIVGGKAKEGGLNGLEIYKDAIKQAFLIGEAADDFAKWMDQYGIDYHKCSTLDKAVAQAHNMAQDGRGQPGGAGCVLLSPACASYDQFQSFEHRGDVFTALVDALPEDGGA
tara:strand:- start:336 stop:1760 length:1425 start_codon:yes stop_codon:yes gene_type:complete